MKTKTSLLLTVLLFAFAFAKAQEIQPTPSEEKAAIGAQDTLKLEEYNPLKPAKAAFYSAVFPGLGQAYNKDYWKIPIVYGALGTGIYFAVDNDREFKRYRTALKQRFAGRDDEFTVDGEEIFTDDGLIRAQDFFRRRKELSILVTVGIYILQIVEANVDAHLSQFTVDDKLSLKPEVYQQDWGGNTNFGLSLNYSF
ncbi:DUF5683 domain-containing protein [Croceiramulus getboli]|nr:DUF5683 domain-containing protein [Flavobacteriaceae bacterium YJPT1-3]